MKLDMFTVMMYLTPGASRLSGISSNTVMCECANDNRFLTIQILHFKY